MNRREALQAGLGILAAVGIDGEVATISAVNPQAFVITATKPISQEYLAAFRRQWKEVFADSPYRDAPVVFLFGGMQLSVVDQKDLRRSQREGFQR